MESAVCVSGFLLLFFSTGVHLSPHPEFLFGQEGEVYRFRHNRWSVSMRYRLLYKVGEDRDLQLLINCSEPVRPQPHGYVEYKCRSDSFEMSKLNMSHSGDYRIEHWSAGNIIEHRSLRLTVCAKGVEATHQWVSYGDSVELCRSDSLLGNGSSLKLYRRHRQLRLMLVLDTNSSLEPLVEDLKGRLQVALNTSLLTLSGVIEQDTDFCCTVWRGAQCQSYNCRSFSKGPKIVFAHEEDNVTLPCFIKGELPYQMYWTTVTGRVQLGINQNHAQEVMYMLNGSQTGDYSLIIPSVSLQHSGNYRCFGRESHTLTELLVCTKVSSLDEMFSPGQSVHLNITEHVNNMNSMSGIQWYRQKILQKQVQIVDFSFYAHLQSPVSLPDDLSGRVTVSKSPNSFYNSSLIISNLTAEDSGVYTWRVYGRSCFEGSFRLVYLDPIGVHSAFYRAYASLIGCGVLGPVAAVIWLKLCSRRGEQTSGCQSRERQQSGDEDLHDEVEMTDLNTPPSAASAVAGEHSV